MSPSASLRPLVAVLLFLMGLAAGHADDGVYVEATLTNQTRVVGLLAGEGIVMDHFVFGDVAFTWEEMRFVRASNFPDEPPGSISIQFKNGESLSGKTASPFMIRSTSNVQSIALIDLDLITFPAKPDNFAAFEGEGDLEAAATPANPALSGTDDPAVKPAAPSRVILSADGFMLGGKLLDAEALVTALRATHKPKDLLVIEKKPGTPGSKTADLLRVLFAAGFTSTRIEE